MLDLIVVVSSIVALLIIFWIIYKFNQAHQHNKDVDNELKQERQDNANIKRDLTQANQKIEHLSNKLEQVKSASRPTQESLEGHLSSENERLTQALKLERQRNANLGRELGVSESSLVQARQHNEQLTDELAQANQRNVNLEREQNHLSIQLRQERKNKAKLERQLKVSRYSGYFALLDGIYSANQLKTDIQKQTYFQKLRNSALELWREYQGSDISPDYSKIDYQEAYLLCYFLPYSQLVPYLLNKLILKKNFSYQLPENGLLTASFFGCGPGPEIFGLMRYLGSVQPSISISAAMLDRESWKHGRKIVRQLLDRVWNSDLYNYNIQEFNADIVGSPSDFLPVDSEEWVKRSDLIVIQHCLNERHNAKSERLVENMKQLVENMKTGAVMLIIERANYVKDLLGQFCRVLQTEFRNSVEFVPNIERTEKIKPLLDIIPKELATNFLIHQRSNSVNSVEFIWVAVVKK